MLAADGNLVSVLLGMGDQHIAPFTFIHRKTAEVFSVGIKYITGNSGAVNQFGIAVRGNQGTMVIYQVFIVEGTKPFGLHPKSFA